MCNETATCFEPEALGHLIEGMPFHRYYFDPSAPPADPTKVKISQNTMSGVHVRQCGNAAILCYIRLVQSFKNGAHVTSETEETRIWEKTPQGFKLVHLHRSKPTRA
eukprot:tig00000269_g23779.t1